MASTLPLVSKANAGANATITPLEKARGANRSTKVAHKLKVLPEQPEPLSQSRIVGQERVEDAGKSRESGAMASAEDEDISEPDEELEDEDEVQVYKAISQIPRGTARKDALKLTKKMAKTLPRVTAYCTATSYNMEDLMKFLNARRTSYHTDPRLFDDVIYTPYRYVPAQPGLAAADRLSGPTKTGDLLGVAELVDDPGLDNDKSKQPRSFIQTVDVSSDIFLFEYGTVVIWGMSEAQERRFLTSLKRFEVEKLSTEDVEMEDLNYYYANYSRIYNDVITLREGSSYMTKLALSHALAQSVKISVFEELIASTIDQTKDIPEIISETGKIGMPHDEIMQQIGQLFILRMNINLVGSILDSPEIFWTFPDLQPLYEAARSYLELPQRISLLNARVEVLQDMLKLLKESVSSRHSERLEQIVILLIGIEILLGLITILVDLFAP